MPVIKLKVENKIVSPLEEYVIVNYNNDYKVEFEFDGEWAGETVKTARFVFGGQAVDVVFDGNRCDMPLIKNATTVGIGVFAGDLESTTKAYIKCLRSVLEDAGVPYEPSKDVYAEIIALLNKYIEQGGGITEDKVVSLINENIAGLQPKTDEELQTISKEIVGAINEVNAKAGQGGVVEETDPTVPAWAKEPNKPTYTWDEITGKPEFGDGADYELIEKVVIGYSITTAQPADWETNYTAYFTNEGTDRNPTYTAVGGDTAPTWEMGKYYKFDGTTKVVFSRSIEPDGTPYALKKFMLYTNAPKGEQVNGYLLCDTDYLLNPGAPYGAQVNVQRWAVSTDVCHTIARGFIDSGRLVLQGGYTTGSGYAVNPLSEGSIMYSGFHIWNKEAHATCITKLATSNYPLLPNTEIYIFGVRV